MRNILSFSILFLFSAALFAFAPFSLKSIEEDYFDFLCLEGASERPYLNYRTLSDNKWFCTNDSENLWINNNLGSDFLLWQPETIKSDFYNKGINQKLTLNIFGPYWFNSYNSTTPFGQNDGALWQGVGYNTSLTTGARLEGYGFELTFKPQLTFSQNKPFEIMKSAYENEYGYFAGYGNGIGIDKPQRFGDKPFFTFDFGDSEIRYNWYNMTIGFGTQAIWLGPAYRNPMLHSNNAPSYPKLDLGLRKQEIVIPGVNWSAGFIEGRIWIGQLTESDYFDSNPANDKRMLAGFSASYSPSFVQGFTVGINKTCTAQWTNSSWKYLNPFFDDNTVGEGKDKGEDQKMSITIDWLFPQIGFEFFGEGAWDDYACSILSNPWHTFTWSIGVKQILPLFPKSKFRIEIILEINDMEMTSDYQLVGNYLGLYYHGGISQGYTNKGQVLGSGTNIGGNSQLAEMKSYHPSFVFSIYFLRFVPDINFVLNKTIYQTPDRNNENGNYNQWFDNYEAYIGGGSEISWFIMKNLSICGGFSLMYINKPRYQKEEWDVNFNGFIGIKYNF